MVRKFLLFLIGMLFPISVAAANTVPVTADLKVGTPVVVEAPAADGKYAVVFEDDGDTGYFYALDLAKPDQPIQEAVAIYNVKDVTDRHLPSKIEIRWSKDQRKAGLWINGYPHAIFDFAAKRGYSRLNFPRPGKWTGQDFAWRDEALKLFE